MSDDKRRARTHKDDDNRANVGAAFRKSGAVPVYVEPDTTEQCDTPEQVRQMRGRRSTEQRVTKLEDKFDVLTGTVTETQVAVGGLVKETAGQTKLIEEIQRGVTRIADRDDVKYQSNLTINEAQQIDSLDARKARRWLLAKGAGAVLGGGTLLELVHWIAGRL